jgi:cell wall assembly regulator SMI1
MDFATADLPRVLSSIERLLRALDLRAAAAGEMNRSDFSKSFPPATVETIAVAERRLSFRFPPSYRTFLLSSNGWKGFPGDWWVFGVSGEALTRPQKEWQTQLSLYEKVYKRRGKGFAAEIRGREATDPNVIYPANHVPLATDFSGSFYLFDRHRRKDEEYEIVETKGGYQVEGRLPNFLYVVDFVRTHARTALQRLGVTAEDVIRIESGDMDPEPMVRTVNSEQAPKARKSATPKARRSATRGKKVASSRRSTKRATAKRPRR